MVASVIWEKRIRKTTYILSTVVITENINNNATASSDVNAKLFVNLLLLCETLPYLDSVATGLAIPDVTLSFRLSLMFLLYFLVRFIKFSLITL